MLRLTHYFAVPPRQSRRRGRPCGRKPPVRLSPRPCASASSTTQRAFASTWKACCAAPATTTSWPTARPRTVWPPWPGRTPLPVDLILMDCIMPGMGGLAGTRRIKADPALADIPVIMVTVSDDDENLAQAFAAGAHGLHPQAAAAAGAPGPGGFRPCASSRPSTNARPGKTRSRRKRSTSPPSSNIPTTASPWPVRAAASPSSLPAWNASSACPSTPYTPPPTGWLDLVFPRRRTPQSDLADILASRPAPGHVWRRLYTPSPTAAGQRRTCQIHFSTMPSGDLILNIQGHDAVRETKGGSAQKAQPPPERSGRRRPRSSRACCPGASPMSDALRFAWEFTPCENIGGDIFNVFPLGPPPRRPVHARRLGTRAWPRRWWPIRSTTSCTTSARRSSTAPAAASTWCRRRWCSRGSTRNFPSTNFRNSSPSST